jgi:hypothetical protein
VESALLRRFEADRLLVVAALAEAARTGAERLLYPATGGATLFPRRPPKYAPALPRISPTMYERTEWRGTASENTIAVPVPARFRRAGFRVSGERSAGALRPSEAPPRAPSTRWRGTKSRPSAAPTGVPIVSGTSLVGASEERRRRNSIADSFFLSGTTASGAAPTMEERRVSARVAPVEAVAVRKCRCMVISYFFEVGRTQRPPKVPSGFQRNRCSAYSVPGLPRMVCPRRIAKVAPVFSQADPVHFTAGSSITKTMNAGNGPS